MKAKRISKHRGKRAGRRRFALEALEPRVVLDAGLGAEVDDVAATDAGFERFESADELQQFLVDKAVDQWQDLFGTTWRQWPYMRYIVEGDLDVPFAVPRLGPDTVLALATQAPGSFDGTNVQVRGIDEADLVKTDGEYLYIASDGRLSIIDARNPAELSLAAEIPFDSYAGELFVSGDRLVLLSNQSSLIYYDFAIEPGGWFPGNNFAPRTSVSIYDISDRTSPTLVQATTIDGNLTASRRIDDLVYLVTTDHFRFPQLGTHCDPVVSDDSPVFPMAEGVAAETLVIIPDEWQKPVHESCIYETKEEYLARLEEEFIELAMPSFETIGPNGEVIDSGILSAPTDTYKPLTDDATGVTSIVVIDLSTETNRISASTSLITNDGSTVYASARNIYVATSSYALEDRLMTTLQQFSIGDDGTTIELAAVGTVPGTLLNQFALDEHDGYLRAVTSVGWGPERTNHLFVLQQLETSLDVVGSIDEIATGESVYAVRFVGDEAFVVTFRVIDPLFTIDLSDPAHPAIVGELEIPGFSNYLHPISEDFVLGLGRDEGGFWGSPQLSLFDVSDSSLPTRVDRFVFEGTTWSEAFHNHHAISYFPDAQIAVVPFQGSFDLCAAAIVLDGCEPRRADAFWVIQIDTASDAPSLQLLGKIEHDDALLRSLRIGDHLFTVSMGSVKVSELLRPDTLIDQLYFGQVAFWDFLTVDSSESESELDVLYNDHVGDDATIIEVSATATGAVVEISEDGKTLLYTPSANSDAANDSFEYTVESGGRRETATVRIHITRESVRDRMVRLAKTALIDRLGPDASPQQIQLGSVTQREWSDSCLGAASGGDVCAQVITPGFEIVLEYELAEFVYHTDTTQRVVLANDPVVEHADLIQIRVEVVNADGELVTSLLAGEEATLQIYAEDLRDNPRGVFAAYFDVLFDPAQVAEIGPIAHGSSFENGRSGTINDTGLVDEVGGFNDQADSNQTLVASIPIVAASPGELRLIVAAADESPAHDSLLFGIDTAIPLNRIRFGEVVVEVLESQHNEDDPMDTNMDGEMTPLDALVVMNHLNRYGSGPVNVEAVQALRAAAAEAHAVRFALDVNRDGFISPIDMLLIINRLEARTAILAEGEAAAALPASTSSTPVAPFLEPAAVELRTTSALPATRRTDTTRAIELEDLFPAADAIDFVARTHTHRTVPLEHAPNEDRFFAELELAATSRWWRS